MIHSIKDALPTFDDETQANSVMQVTPAMLNPSNHLSPAVFQSTSRPYHSLTALNATTPCSASTTPDGGLARRLTPSTPDGFFSRKTAPLSEEILFNFLPSGGEVRTRFVSFSLEWKWAQNSLILLSFF